MTLALAVAASAGAQTVPTCNPGTDTSSCCYTKRNPVFVAGTSAAKSALQAIAAQLPEISIIYQTPDSCIALAAVEVSPPQPVAGALVTNNWLAPDGTTPLCTMSAGALTNPQEAVDIAVSDIFPATCQTNLGYGGITAGQQVDVLGPIQGQTIDVPSASTATSISAEAAKLVFGYGATAPSNSIEPWGNPANILIRPSTSGTLNLIGTVIGLPGLRWKNAALPTMPVQVQTSSLNMFTAIATAAPGVVDSTIGILSAQYVLQSDAKAVADGGTGKTIKTLAFQAKGQNCGFYPDSVSNSGDKINIREGRYAIWGPAHLVANVGADGNPTGVHAAAVTAVLNAFIATGCEGAGCPPGSSQLLGGADAGPLSTSNASIATNPSEALKQAVVGAESSPIGGVVPWCAMQVTRGNVEAGPEASYQPSEPCGCYFEKKATGATASPYCKVCNVKADCNPGGATSAYPVCRYGYCEAQ
jgi:hypothetical protein